MDLPLSSVDGDGVAGDRVKNERITCYSYDSKREYPNYVKCPSSDSCCETIEQCRPDRLCTSKEDPKTLIRPPCAYKPWTNSCAQVCLYDNKDSPILPRAVVCEQPGPSDGSYCCDDNRTCCIDRAGFFLDQNGLLIGRANETDNSTLSPKPIGVSVTALRGMGSSSTTATSSPVRSPAKDKPGLSTAAKAGIGVGVGVVVLLAVIAGALLFLRSQRRKKKRARATSTSATGTAATTAPSTADAQTETWDDEDKQPLPSAQRLEKEEERAYELMGDGATPELHAIESPLCEAPPSELPLPPARQEQTQPIELPADQPTGKPRRG